MRLIAVVLLTSAVACAQQDDIAAAARASKEQQKSVKPAAKVYTNDDLGTAAPEKENAAAKEKVREKELAKLPPQKQDRAKQIVKQILQQREQIAKLQEHYDKLQAIQAERDQLKTPPPFTTQECANEPERCEARRAFANDLGKTQKQIEAAKKKLDDMEDAARKDGYPPSVFDP